jgi:hypothetical protein
MPNVLALRERDKTGDGRGNFDQLTTIRPTKLLSYHKIKLAMEKKGK